MTAWWLVPLAVGGAAAVAFAGMGRRLRAEAEAVDAAARRLRRAASGPPGAAHGPGQ